MGKGLNSIMSHLLTVENLRTHFRTREGEVRAVRDVTFSVAEGETLAVVGESGCGKSVTALSIMRLLPAAGSIVGGRIQFAGTDLLGRSEREMRDLRGNRVAMVFQDPLSSLNPFLRIGAQVCEAMVRHLGLGRRRARERAIELLTRAGLDEPARRIDQHPHQLSGGQRQRVMIAMAISCEPALLIADEPTTALDVTIQAQILGLLKRLQADAGMAMILITHDLGVVAGVCERVAVMYAGQIVESAPTDLIYADPRHPYTKALMRCVPRLDQPAHTQLESIPGQPPSLMHEPQGCAFAPRCPLADARCREDEPLPESIGPDHEVRCWHAGL